MHEAPEVVAVFAGGGTGGHLYPALALAEALGELRPDVRPVFLGATRGLEARVLPEREVEHHLLPVRGFERGSLWRNWRVVPALVRALGRVVMLFRRLDPALVVATGGYACAPAGIAARLLGVPLVLQEQNAYPGVTTRFLARWARQIHLAFPEAAEHLPSSSRERVRVSGNPVRARQEISGARARFELEAEGPVVLVVGGSQGARALNQAVLEALRDVGRGALARPAGLQLLWATGPAHHPSVSAALDELDDASWVRALGYIDDMPAALSAADLAVGRAGAIFTSECLLWGLPTILVPLPTAAGDHQRRNAEALSGAGAAVQLPEEELTGPALWKRVVDLVEDPERLDRISIRARRRAPEDASRTIARSLAELLPTREVTA